MGASTLKRRLSRLCGWFTVLVLLLGAPALAAQVPVEPILRGRVVVNGVGMDAGMVVLHRVSTDEQGEVDSIRTAQDGSFSFRLPTLPDPERNDVYFASIRYSGILYFGAAVTRPVQLDSIYGIDAFDTLSVEPGGHELPIRVRNTFLEAFEGGWQVTDLLQIRNDGDRTLVARDGGAVWRYPLATGARDHTVGQGGIAPEAIDFEGGDLVVRAPIPPGERLVTVRYVVDDPFVELPAPGVTETMEFLVREPAPVLVSSELAPNESVELEPGTTYRRFSGANLANTVVRFTEGDAPARFPVEWLAVILALILTGFGVAALSRSTPASVTAVEAPSDSRKSLLLEIARMDEAFEALDDPSNDDRASYERRRRELFRRLRPLS